MNLSSLWQKVLSELELQTSKANFQTWLKNSNLKKINEGIAIIAVSSNFAKEWIENKYHKLILKSLRNLIPNIKTIEYIIDTNLTQPTFKNKKETDLKDFQLSFPEVKIDFETGLNSRYQFENFVVGPSNELAVAASLAVTESPGVKYNPLFIYGGVGLGKTHLIQATGNAIKNKFENKKIKYLSSEKFTNEVIEAIRFKDTKSFREKYRNVDVLIIDDIQFISGKETTQMEFFHTFNELYSLNKQIIISSDRAPSALPEIEERLKSRFEGGMIADITKPEFETRIAILHQKMKERNYYLPEEIVELLATRIQDNIRNLEGALNLIVNSLKYQKLPPTKKNAEKILKKILQPKKIINFKKILNTVSEFYDLDPNQIVSKCRKKELVKPRQIIMYLSKEELGFAYSTIAEKLGNRDHTTVLYACQKISKEIQKNPVLEEEINQIKSRLYKTL